MAARVLNAAGRALVGGLILEGLTWAEINARLSAAGYPELSKSAFTVYRRKHHAETMARDLEVLQAGETRFLVRASALAKSAEALLRFAITENGNLSGEKDALFALKVHSETCRELNALLAFADKRIIEAEKAGLEAERLRFEKSATAARLRIEEAAEKRAAEKWAIERDLIGRELGLLEKMEAAAALGVGGEPAGPVQEAEGDGSGAGEL